MHANETKGGNTMKNRMKRLGIILSVAAVGLVGTFGTASAAVAPQGHARGATTVTLNQDTIGAVIDLGLTPGAVAPGVLGMSDDDLQAAFPIVGNLKGGVIKHTGGLSLSAGGTVLTLTNYFIDLRDAENPILTALAAVNGDEVGRVTLFDLGAAAPQSGCAATASLSLDAQAAGALTAVFGAPDLTGADFGDACVAPR
jgi:hypothetical protein